MGPNMGGEQHLPIENTLPAFAACIAQGADGIEFDVRLTRDSRLVVYHDDRIAQIERSHKSHYPLIREMTAKQINEHRFCSGTQIPLFVDVLNFVVMTNQHRARAGQKNLRINVELKEGDSASYVLKEIAPFLETRKIDANSLLFNSSHWFDLKKINDASSNLRICPNIKPAHFEPIQNAGDNDRWPLSPFPQTAIGHFLKKAKCYGIDIRLSDFSDCALSLCQKHQIALVACECHGILDTDLRQGIGKMLSASRELPEVILKSNNVSRARRLISQQDYGPNTSNDQRSHLVRPMLRCLDRVASLAV